MTLDEAIKHAEEVAEKNEKQASWFWCKEGNPFYEKCVECAEEHRQLAKWLKDYKRLLEQEPCDDESIAKAFQIGVAFGFGEKHDKMDRVIDEILKR